MTDLEFALILPVAILFDVLFGDPQVRLHPVRIIDSAIEGGILFFRDTLKISGYIAGLVLLLINLLFFLGLYGLLAFALYERPAYLTIPIHGFIVYSCIRFRHYLDLLPPLIHAIREEELDDARDEFQKFGSREVSYLKLPGLARASIEHLAHGLIRGLVAPLFWFVIGSLVGLWSPLPLSACAVSGMLLYRVTAEMKAVSGPGWNTDNRLHHVGFVASELLDVLPARLSLVPLTAAGALLSMDLKNGWYIWLRDRTGHPSINQGQTESLIAGMLHLKLGGPTVYPNGIVERPWIGDGTPDAGVPHLKQCARLFLTAGFVTYLLFLFSIVPILLYG